jgi:hypothetical protein
MAIKKILVTVVLSGLVGACGSVASNLPSMDQNATTITASCAANDSASTALRRADDGGGKGKAVALTVSRADDGGGKGKALALTVSRADDGGGKGRYGFAANALQCSTYVVEISGVCNDCASVLVEASDKAASVTVNQDGTFNYSFETTTITNIDLTPLSF